MHGGDYECERCCVEQQLDHAIEAAGKLEELKWRLHELGGRAPEEVVRRAEKSLEASRPPMERPGVRGPVIEIIQISELLSELLAAANNRSLPT